MDALGLLVQKTEEDILERHEDSMIGAPELDSVRFIKIKAIVLEGYLQQIIDSDRAATLNQMVAIRGIANAIAKLCETV